MRSPAALFLAALVLLVLVAWIDYATGPELGFFVFYFAPISLPAWYLGKRMAIAFSLLAMVAWLVVEELGGRSYSSEFYRYWNGGIRLASFLLIGLSLPKIAEALAREKKLNDALSRSLNEVKRLGGLLPICAHCKKIRDDEGYWHQVEAYVRDNSEAEFSHGICPGCLERLYSETNSGMESD